MVITWAAKESPIWIARAVVPRPRLMAPAALSVPNPRAVAPVVIAALAVNVANPLAERVVNAPAAGVVPPCAGGAAKTAAKLEGVTKRAKTPVDAVPATASASVANSPIPCVTVVETGAPAIAIPST